MAVEALAAIKRARSNSGSTIRPSISNEEPSGKAASLSSKLATSVQLKLSTHIDAFSKEHALFAEACLAGNGFQTGDLVEIRQASDTTSIRDFEKTASTTQDKIQFQDNSAQASGESHEPVILCVVKPFPAEQVSKHQSVDLSLNKHIVSTFEFSPQAQLLVTATTQESWTATHVEIFFRDAYLSRSDMWRFACQELVGKPIYSGQRLTFLNSLKATVKGIHVAGKNTRTAYFGPSTVPIFRSEAARYVIFIQMSREMWDFDSEGNGEILFNRVVNGFLPELFKRWSRMEVRHLVSIVMFGRLEYKDFDMAHSLSASFGGYGQSPSPSGSRPIDHQDFYRVVVTDMASAQWTTILNELKRDFRVFLKDVSLFKVPENVAHAKLSEKQTEEPVKITGRLSGSLKGNVLEAINLAASQFSNDYVDRDLIRTGISTVVITAGSGVFDVDRDLLKLTSETLTNNGIGIDIVCLSKMPLHSVPLFRYRLKDTQPSESGDDIHQSVSPGSLPSSLPHLSLPDLSGSPAFSSTKASLTYFSRFPSAFPARLPQIYGYGIPQWIDLSYWSPEMGYERSSEMRRARRQRRKGLAQMELFSPRVRMYELQMMGLMELGMADISIPYLAPEDTLDVSNSARRKLRSGPRQFSRSGSRSPELIRKSPAGAMSSKRKEMGASFAHKDASTQSKLAYMGRYDDHAFTSPRINVRTARLQRSVKEEKPQTKPLESPRTQLPQAIVRPLSPSIKTMVASEDRSDTMSLKSLSSATSNVVRPSRISRLVSYSARGLMPMKSGTAAAEVQVENVKAQKSTLAPANVIKDEIKLETRPRTSTLLKTSKTATMANTEVAKPGSTATNREESATKPISIGASVNGGDASADEGIKRSSEKRHQKRPHSGVSERFENYGPESDAELLDFDEDTVDLISTPSSIPESTIPFIQNVNASNPLKRRSYQGAFGRWQHLYPRKPKSATVKWRSLCTPASVPLTTEEFPSRDELETNFETEMYEVRATDMISPPNTTDNALKPLLIEMISLRIAHGYQFVTGQEVSKIFGCEIMGCYAFSDLQFPIDKNVAVVLIMGNAIQKLEALDSNRIRVTKWTQRKSEEELASLQSIDYIPYLRTILANDYFPRSLVLRGYFDHYPWREADDHLMVNEAAVGDSVARLRYWRARFVLLPVEPPASTWKKHQQDENEEEIHLLGIRALTQLWQKNRVMTEEEKQNQQQRVSSTKLRDENPLQVKMETLNPTELVALELDRLTLAGDPAQTESQQLLPETQKLDRDTGMAKIAQVIQGEAGVEIKTRRWHLRSHSNCFHGEEFTNWLLQNVKGMNTRSEAVEFGNQLMKEGLFEHVNGRHHFKDGNYFYSINPQYRTVHKDQPKSWFLPSRPSEKSVPATPVSEKHLKDISPQPTRTRSGSNIALQLNTTPSSEKPATDKTRKSVSLSRMIRVNVDTRKRSFLGRPEAVNVHYDRFHNPENCYHLELNWLSTTCKLVDDAIVSWTNVAERYGLKLVEVPIAEASSVPQAEPFRNPYRVKLAVEPPKPKATNIHVTQSFFSSALFGPPLHGSMSSNASRHLHQKAILKRSNFVLDLEAANEFPDGVDINYSWGRLDYKFTQYVHRSGVILAQIMEDGDIILLANRLYNSRLVNTKDAVNRMYDMKKDSGPQSHRPAVPPSAAASMQASGLVGVNLASPTTAGMSSPGLAPLPNLNTGPSPNIRPLGIASTTNGAVETSKHAIADTFGPRSRFAATGLWNTLITPEQIKDDLEAFCQDKSRLEAFYKEVTIATASTPSIQPVPGTASRKATGSSSSSLLRPIRELPGTMASDIQAIPAFELPEAVSASRQLRRATVQYDHQNEMFDRSKNGSRHGSVGSGSNGHSERDTSERASAIAVPPSPLRQGSK